MEATSNFEAVSCTVVAIPGVHNPTGLESHDFFHLFVPTTSITGDTIKGFSIDVCILISAIKTVAAHHSTGEIPQGLYTLLTDHLSFPELRLSTTRLPIFDAARMQNPAFGYRALGYFSRHSYSSSPSSYIRAIDSHAHWDYPEVLAWKPQLESLQARLDYHFIIVLSDYGARRLTSQPSNPLSPPSGSAPPHLYQDVQPQRGADPASPVSLRVESFAGLGLHFDPLYHFSDDLSCQSHLLWHSLWMSANIHSSRSPPRHFTLLYIATNCKPPRFPHFSDSR